MTRWQKHTLTKSRPEPLRGAPPEKRVTKQTAESYRDRFLKPNARISRLFRLARMIRKEAAA